MSDSPYEFVPVWKGVTEALAAELTDFWARNRAIPDADRAAARARQAVCIARGADGALVGVGTAVMRILPRLRQPMYYYRQFFSPDFRGQKRTGPFFNFACEILQSYNAALKEPESLGVLVELESAILASRYILAHEPTVNSTFIGYSQKGLQLRVTYFEGAKLHPLRALS
jgi:hypothetical protein